MFGYGSRHFIWVTKCKDLKLPPMRLHCGQHMVSYYFLLCSTSYFIQTVGHLQKQASVNCAAFYVRIRRKAFLANSNLVICTRFGSLPLVVTVEMRELIWVVFCDESDEILHMNDVFVVLSRPRHFCRPSSHRYWVPKWKNPVRIVLGRSIICFIAAILSVGVNGLAVLPTLRESLFIWLVLLPMALVRWLDISATPLMP